MSNASIALQASEAVRRDEDAVALEEVQNGCRRAATILTSGAIISTGTIITLRDTASPVRNRPAAVDTQEHPEGCTVRLHWHEASRDFCVQEHAPDLEIFASAEHLIGPAGAILQYTHRLLRLRRRMKVSDRKRFLDVELSFLSVFADAVVVVQPVGEVRALLDFDDQRAGANRMHRACLHEADVVLVNRHFLEVPLD